MGVSSKTIGEWINLLETSNVIFKLRPWYGNLGKRLVKSPKIYFTDVGLVAMLLGIETEQQLVRDPLFGNIFENLVVVEVMKSALNRNLLTEFFYFRTETGVEVDLLFKRDECWNAVEVKSAYSINPEFFKNMDKLSKLNGFENLKKTVIYSGETIKSYKDVFCCNFAKAGSIV